MPTSVTSKNFPNVYKRCPIVISNKKIFWHLYKNCVRMWKIWANLLLPQTLEICPKSNKLPNLVTLTPTLFFYDYFPYGDPVELLSPPFITLHWRLIILVCVSAPPSSSAHSHNEWTSDLTESR